MNLYGHALSVVLPSDTDNNVGFRLRANSNISIQNESSPGEIFMINSRYSDQQTDKLRLSPHTINSQAGQDCKRLL